MEISIRTKESYIAELTIHSGNTKMVEDLVERKDKAWVISDSVVEQFISIAFDCSRFNKKTDVETIKMIIDNFLNDSEKYELKEILNEIK